MTSQYTYIIDIRIPTQWTTLWRRKIFTVECLYNIMLYTDSLIGELTFCYIVLDLLLQIVNHFLHTKVYHIIIAIIYYFNKFSFTIFMTCFEKKEWSCSMQYTARKKLLINLLAWRSGNVRLNVGDDCHFTLDFLFYIFNSFNY